MTQRIVWRKIVDLGGRPEFWLVALLLWALVSAGRSLGTPWAAAAGTEALRWAAGIGLALALSGFLRRTAVAGRVFVLLAGAMALYGILGGASAQDGLGQNGLVGPYREHQLYGSVLLLLLPFAAAAALSAKTPSWRWGSLAALAAGTLCLFLSETRSAWIGLAAAGLVFGGLRLRQITSDFSPKRLILVPCAVLLAGLGLLWLVSSPGDQQAALSSRAATLAALGQDQSWQTRLQMWRGTARLVEAHPALGVGLGRFPGAEWAWTHTGGMLTPTESPSLSNEAHSFYGQTAAEIGLPGLCLYLAALAAFAVPALRRLREKRPQARSGQSALLLAALSALAGQSIDAFASPSWQFPEASFLFWAVLGLGLASLKRGAANAAPDPLPFPLRRAGQWALSGGLAVTATALILPLGLLLTPVEAYTAPTGYTLVSRSLTLLTPGSTFTTGNVLQFQVIATYHTASGAVVTYDVTSDLDTAYSGTLTSGTGAEGVPAKSLSGGTYTVPSRLYTKSSTLAVNALYTDPGLHKTVPASPVPLTIQIRPS